MIEKTNEAPLFSHIYESEPLYQAAYVLRAAVIRFLFIAGRDWTLQHYYGPETARIVNEIMRWVLQGLREDLAIHRYADLYAAETHLIYLYDQLHTIEEVFNLTLHEKGPVANALLVFEQTLTTSLANLRQIVGG